MSEKILRGINFPGLEGTYMVPQVDATLSASGASADAKVVGDEIKSLQNAIRELGSEFKYTDVTNLLIDSYDVNSGSNYYSCNYGTSISVQDGGVVVDEELTATSANSLDTMTSTLKDNYAVLGSGIYYIPEDATFATSNATENYITTYYLYVDKAQLVEANTGGVSVSTPLIDFLGMGYTLDDDFNAQWQPSETEYNEVLRKIQTGAVKVRFNVGEYPTVTNADIVSLSEVDSNVDAALRVWLDDVSIQFTILMNGDIHCWNAMKISNDSGSDNVLVVRFTTTDGINFEKSHTHSEICDAIESGMNVYATVNDRTVLQLVEYSREYDVRFASYMPFVGGMAGTIHLDSYDEIRAYEGYSPALFGETKVGQVAVVKSVNVGFQPIEWESMDMPALGKIEEVELINGTYTTELQSDLGAYGAIIPYTKELDAVPATINVTVDGVAYRYLSVTNVPGLGDCAGNLSMLNPMGFTYPDTGEPFVVGVAEDAALFTTDLTQSKTVSLNLSVVEGDVTKTLAPEYLAPNPVQDKVLAVGQCGLEWKDNVDAIRFVTITYNTSTTGTASHSAAEVREMVDTGKLVILQDDGINLLYVSGDETQAHFAGLYSPMSEYGAQNWEVAHIDADKNFSCEPVNGMLVPIPTNEDIGKVLSVTADGLAWVTPTGGTTPSSEGVEF